MWSFYLLTFVYSCGNSDCCCWLTHCCYIFVCSCGNQKGIAAARVNGYYCNILHMHTTQIKISLDLACFITHATTIVVDSMEMTHRRCVWFCLLKNTECRILVWCIFLLSQGYWVYNSKLATHFHFWTHAAHWHCHNMFCFVIYTQHHRLQEFYAVPVKSCSFVCGGGVEGGEGVGIEGGTRV